MAPRSVLQKKFRVFILLSLFVLLMEITGGIFSNSLALLSDAGHVLIDLLALGVSYFSMRLSQRKSTKRFTFGYYRAEILAAVINGALLIFVTLYIFYESYIRFISPQPVRGIEMLAISVAGFLANLYVVIKMQGHEKQNLNLRGAYLHVLGDTSSSIGVVIAGILILVTGNYIFDPIISVIIGLFILVSSIQLIRESSHILMEATPEGIELERVSKDIKKIRGVKEIHDIHIWSISSDVHALSAHILIGAKNIKSMNKTVSRINAMLKSEYNISYTVIQPECRSCVGGRKYA